ncbi:MAG TPA: hypothetical protein VFC29_02680 [Candidatus Limnocylindrales bacterium]|nr:hypothetical protein [Candidatus Limnocylindrales bacterium]
MQQPHAPFGTLDGATGGPSKPPQQRMIEHGRVALQKVGQIEKVGQIMMRRREQNRWPDGWKTIAESTSVSRYLPLVVADYTQLQQLRHCLVER